MNDKLQESLQYLKQCSNLESETFKLYETLSKKLNQPESGYIIGNAYNSLKNARIIQGILNCFDLTEVENKPVKKELAELTAETILLEKKISKINSLEYLITCEMLKEAINLENLLIQTYTKFLESNSAKVTVTELAKTGTLTFDNFKKLFEYIKEEKAKNKEAIVESLYILEFKVKENQKQITPIVKYQNPDAWIHESTIHTFADTPVTES
jgi:hypothetical protein